MGPQRGSPCRRRHTCVLTVVKQLQYISLVLGIEREGSSFPTFPLACVPGSFFFLLETESLPSEKSSIVALVFPRYTP